MFKSLLLLILNLSCLAMLSGCLGGSEDHVALNSSASTGSVTLLSYDNATAQINVKGTISIPGTVQLTSVVLHLNSTCSDNPIGQGLQTDFSTIGVTATIPSTQTVSIYLATTTFTGCYLLANYTVPHTAPSVPVVTSTSPVSPSRTSTTPQVFGSVTGFASQVRFYSDALCTTLIGGGTPAALSSVGIQLSVPANTATLIYGQSIEPFGNASTCTKVGAFTHSTMGPVNPVFTAVNPVSPSTVTTPLVIGTLTTDAISITLYGDAGCLTQVGTGTAADYQAAGILANLPSNQTTSIYGIAFDANANPSLCTYLTTFVSDSIAPGAPVYTGSNPTNPTRLTLYPRIIGTTASDTSRIKFFSNSLCTVNIGNGSKAEFESTGTTAAILSNATTTIYATAIDAAGNSSPCSHLTDFINNTIPPDPPVFSATDPVSPNNKSGTPLVTGIPSSGTVSVQIYSDENCATTLIGSGSSSTFSSPGILTTVPANVDTTLYATGTDLEGNISTCTTLATYGYSTRAAVAPGFTQSIPRSPSRTVTTPSILGTADRTISKIQFYRESTCTTVVATGTRGTYISGGIQVPVLANTTNTIYAVALDVYGNVSPCTHLVDYVHDNVAPLDPTYLTTNPVSPNNQSVTPLIIGNTANRTGKILPINAVKFYDSLICVNQLGAGLPTDYVGTGIQLSVPADINSQIYGQTSDAAGNVSNCVLLTNYFHNSIKPGIPTFISATPASPSYSQLTSVKGKIGTTKSLMPAQTVVLYSDVLCQTILSSGTPTLYAGTGLPTTMTENHQTTVYASVFDQVGNVSGCKAQTNFVHNDIGPSNLAAASNANGSVTLTWQPDLTASPSAQYVLKRSVRAGGPYSVISANLNSTSYNDINVSNNVTYYYVVDATNNTGTSFDSTEASSYVNAGTPGTVVTLLSSPGPEVVSLTWTGFSSDMTFSVLRSLQSGGPYTAIAKGLTNVTYSDGPLTDLTPYYYVVVGVNPQGRSVKSNETRAVPLTSPSAPVSLSMSLQTNNSTCNGRGVVLTWSAPSYFTGFSISRSRYAHSNSNFTQVNANTYVDCNPYYYNQNDINQNYYNVSATWGGGNSVSSNEVVMSNNTINNIHAYPGNNELNLQWDGDSVAQNYTIFRSTQSGGPYAQLASGVSSSQYNDSTVTNGTAYYYVVQNTYTGGILGWISTEVAGIPGATVAAPTNLTITQNASHQPVLNWTPPLYYNGFTIYRKASADASYSLIASTDRILNQNSTTYTDSGVTITSDVYSYKVATRWGSVESSAIGPVTFQTGAASDLALTATSSSLNLTWSALSGATGYKILRSTTSGGPYTTLTTVTATTYSDTSAAINTGYFYVVAAVYSGGQGVNSPEVNGVRTGATIPTALVASNVTSNGATLSWLPVVSASPTYFVYQSLSAGSGFTKVNTVATAFKTYNVSNLTGDTTYYFKVTSVSGGVESAASSTISIYTAAVPTAPFLLSNPSSVSIQCSTMNNATYTIQRSLDDTWASPTIITSGVSTPSGSDTTIVAGHYYYYRCVAQTSSGPTFTSPSTGISAGLVPAVPTGLTVTQNTAGDTLVINFAAVPGATGYKLYGGTASGSYFGFLTATAGTNGIVSIPFTSLTAGTSYFFAAVASIGTTDSALSSEISAIPLATPNAPTALASSTTAIKIDWSSVGYSVSDYSLLRSSDGVTYSTIAASLGTATTYTDSTAVSGVPYTYAYQPYGPSHRPMARSAPSGSVTIGISPIAPQNLYAVADSTTSVQLSWPQVPNTANYEVLRSTTSGSGYAHVAYIPVLSSATTTYADTGLTAGTTYYYVLVAINSVNVSSPKSNEAAVQLSAPLSGLTAVASANAINLNWTASGAPTYEVHRSEVSGGPNAVYGRIASGLTSPTFIDTTVKSGTTYYYVVNGVYANSARTPNSNEAVATGIVTMNLEVPIEMTDRALSSNTTPVTFERTRTTLTTSDYDGTVSYGFEVVAQNSQSTAATVTVVNAAGNTAATLTIPANTFSLKRIRVSWTPSVGYGEYRIATSATTSADSIVVQSARMIVDQIGASKTKIYIPLASSSLQATHDDLAPVETVTATTYNQLSSTTIFTKDTSNLADLANENAWEFEALASTTAGSRASAVLYNVTQGDIVYDTQTTLASPSIGLIHAPFSEGTTNFGPTNEGNQIEVSVRCEINCGASSTVSLYKAGLWVRLTRLTSATVFYRVARGTNVFTNQTFDQQRTFFDLTKFSNPVANFFVTGSTSAGDSSVVQLITAGTSDQGAASPGTTVVGSSLTFNSLAKAQVSTSSPITINSGDRVLVNAAPNSGTFNFVDGTVHIIAHP